MIWIIGGTSEGRKLAHNIKDLDNFVVTVATESGKEFLDTDNYKVGRMTPEQMENFVDENNIKVIVDLTHPFAKIVSENAKIVAENKNIDYIRYSREKINSEEGIVVSSYEECYEYIKDLEGTFFFTTGSNNIKDFEKVRGNNKFIYRILPAMESIQKCVDNNVHIRDIVAILGPFSVDYNVAMFKEYKADYVVMKDSGKTGGTNNKIEACRRLNIKPIIIDREDENGFKNLEELESYIRKNY